MSQVTTFSVGDAWFGIDVMEVQEVMTSLPTSPVPRAPHFVKGLINLRGQIATALGMRDLLGKEGSTDQPMAVVCKLEGNLVSLIVDSIGDVIEVEQENFEKVPSTVPLNIQKYVKGVYKMEDGFLNLINLEAISKELLTTHEKEA